MHRGMAQRNFPPCRFSWCLCCTVLSLWTAVAVVLCMCNRRSSLWWLYSDRPNHFCNFSLCICHSAWMICAHCRCHQLRYRFDPSHSIARCPFHWHSCPAACTARHCLDSPETVRIPCALAMGNCISALLERIRLLFARKRIGTRATVYDNLQYKLAYTMSTGRIANRANTSFQPVNEQCAGEEKGESYNKSQRNEMERKVGSKEKPKII